MESAALRSARSPATPTQVALVGGLLVLAAGAWVVTGDRMAGMDAAPGADLGSLGWFTVSWLVMMAAMMLPSLAPAALTVTRRRPRNAAAFATGYLLVWTTAGLVAYALLAFVSDRDLAILAWHHGGRYLAAGVILAAAAYQFTRTKSRCLTHCRSVRVGSGQARGSAWTGVRHGGWCLGCCATLMAALFALGLMSLTWMVVVAVLISAERLLPWPRATVYAVAAVLIVLGTWMALAPGDLPGLTLPGAMSAM